MLLAVVPQAAKSMLLAVVLQLNGSGFEVGFGSLASMEPAAEPPAAAESEATLGRIVDRPMKYFLTELWIAFEPNVHDSRLHTCS